MLYKIEALIQKAVQDWIADPLQFSGIDLASQVRAACIAIAALLIFMVCCEAGAKDWLSMAITALVIPFAVATAVYFNMSSVATVLFKHEWCLWGGLVVGETVGALLVSSIDIRGVVMMALYLMLFLRWFLCQCRPKPPVGKLQQCTQ